MVVLPVVKKIAFWFDLLRSLYNFCIMSYFLKQMELPDSISLVLKFIDLKKEDLLNFK